MRGRGDAMMLSSVADPLVGLPLNWSSATRPIPSIKFENEVVIENASFLTAMHGSSPSLTPIRHNMIGSSGATSAVSSAVVGSDEAWARDLVRLMGSGVGDDAGMSAALSPLRLRLVMNVCG